MLVFLTCIRHPDTTSNYNAVSELFEKTARSACGQVEGNSRLIVIGNVEPNIEYSHESYEFIKADLPIPKDRNMKTFDIDKGYKRLVGLQRALDIGASHVMLLDADDYVSKYLTRELAKMSEQESFYLSTGYMLDHGAKTAHLKHGLQRYCGSTIIYAVSHIASAFELDHNKGPSHVIDVNELIGRNSDRQLDVAQLLGSHHRPVPWLKSNGYKVKRFPKPAIAYVVNNGQNVFWTTTLRWGPPISLSVVDRFNLHPVDEFDAVPQLSKMVALRSYLESYKSLVGARYDEYKRYGVSPF